MFVGVAVSPKVARNTIRHVVASIEGLFVVEDEAAGDGSEDFVADFRGDFFGVVGGFWAVIGVVGWLVWGGWGLAGKLVLEADDFGVFVGVLDAEENAGADAGEGENREDEDDREKFVFRLVDFRFHDGRSHRSGSGIRSGWSFGRG